MDILWKVYEKQIFRNHWEYAFTMLNNFILLQKI